MSIDGPESVKILRMSSPMLAGQRYDIQCVAAGARPAPAITWWIGSTMVNGLQTKLEVWETMFFSYNSIIFVV